MFCTNCGAQLPDSSRFCNKCGVAVDGAVTGTRQEEMQGGEEFIQDPFLPEGIFQDEDGAYHWKYHMDMMRNPVPLFTLMKLFLIICFCMGALLGLSVLIGGGDPMDAFQAFAVPAFGIGAFFMVLSLIAWCIMMLTRGGCYTFEFLMTEDQVVTIQTKEERERAKNLAAAGFVLSLLDKNLTMAGASMAVAAGDVFTSRYTDVKAVIAARRHDLIKVNNVLQHNTIYAEPHQYEFVWNYITSHCPDAKIKG